MANALDMLGRAALQIMGYTPEQIRQAARANKTPKPMPKPKASKPPAPKPTAKPIQPVGQTNLFNQAGKPRDFTKPNVSANRPPTMSPVYQRGTAGLNPGPVRPPQVAPGQMSIFGTNPGAKPSGNFTAPSVPKPGQGVDPTNWLRKLAEQRRMDAAANRAVRSMSTSNAVVGGLPTAALGLQIANAIQDRMLSPDDLKVKQANSISKENMFRDFQTREQVLGRPMYGPGGSPTGSGQGQAQQVNPNNISSVQPGGLFYRGNGAPAAPAPAPAPAAAPQQQPSVYAPRATEAPRPNRPVASQPAPAAPAAPAANPYAGIGDVRGNQLGTTPSGSFGIDKTNMAAPRTPTDPDYERRRAFLDAPDSLSGMQAVRDLLKRRKLSISVSD